MRAASSVASDSPIASSRKQWKGEEDVWGMVHSGLVVCPEPYRTFKFDDMAFRVLAAPAAGRLHHTACLSYLLRQSIQTCSFLLPSSVILSLTVLSRTCVAT